MERSRPTNFSRTVPVWAALVTAAALPVALAMWQTLNTRDRIGVGAGIAAWIAAMVALDSWRNRHDSVRPARGLMVGAVIYITAEWLVALLAPREALLVVYGPAVAFAGRLILAPSSAGDALSAFVLTCACGGEALVIILGIERLVSRLTSAPPPPEPGMVDSLLPL